MSELIIIRILTLFLSTPDVPSWLSFLFCLLADFSFLAALLSSFLVDNKASKLGSTWAWHIRSNSITESAIGANLQVKKL